MRRGKTASSLDKLHQFSLTDVKHLSMIQYLYQDEEATER